MIKGWNRRLVTAVAATSLLLASLPLTAQAALSPSEFESCLLTQINNDRTAAGVAPMSMAWDRIDTVRWWSEWMSQNTFRHMTSSERAPALPDGTFTWGENIAMHYYTAGDCSYVHNMLMNSDGHRANILRSSFRFAALGAYRNSSGWWVTEVFFNATGYPPAPDPVPCDPAKDCDSVLFQDAGGRFTLWNDLADGGGSSFYFGNPGDVSFSGDWDCDGVDTPGLYRQADGYVYLRNSNTQGVADIRFFFGAGGDYPIAGDFDGDGCDTVSVYRPSEARFYIINHLGANDGGLGAADYSFLFGNFGDKPFVGDFNGDGIDTVGLHRESTGLVYYRNTNTTGVADESFIYGDPGDVLVAGDWNGDGVDTVGVFRPSTGMVYLRYSNSAGLADAQTFAGQQMRMSALKP